MTNSLQRLLKDERGANLVEFAIALPVLIFFIYGIFTIGLLFQANAGLQHALGEAARHATIFPTPSDDDIRARVAAKKFGTGTGTLGSLQIVSDTTGGGGTQSKTLTLSYTQPTNFLFFRGPTVTITKSKKVYTSV
jgi:Flp pilus assembly protein TadG